MASVEIAESTHPHLTMSLTADETSVVREALRQGLITERSVPGYLPASWCTALTFLLAPPSFGFSLLLVPLVWVAQHDHTANRIQELRQRLTQGDATAGPFRPLEAA
jgi:hypothetical protein